MEWKLIAALRSLMNQEPNNETVQTGLILSETIDIKYFTMKNVNLFIE